MGERQRGRGREAEGAWAVFPPSLSLSLSVAQIPGVLAYLSLSHLITLSVYVSVCVSTSQEEIYSFLAAQPWGARDVPHSLDTVEGLSVCTSVRPCV